MTTKTFAKISKFHPHESDYEYWPIQSAQTITGVGDWVEAEASHCETITNNQTSASQKIVTMMVHSSIKSVQWCS